MEMKFVALGIIVAGGVLASISANAQETAAPTAPAATDRAVTFAVYLPVRDHARLEKLIEDQQNPESPRYHQWLTPAQFARRFGPTATAINHVKSALEAGGFTVTRVHSRSLQVVGTADRVQHFFNTRLNAVASRFSTERLVAENTLTLPAALTSEGAVIANFSRKLPAHAMVRNIGLVSTDSRAGNAGGYYYNDLKQAYDYPAYTTRINGRNLDGTGARVAVLMDNDVLDSDIQAMFNNEHFQTTTHQPAPTLAGRVYINGGAPFDPNLSTEASLDVQQVLGGAPGASVTLVDLPDLSDDNILAGLTEIVESNDYDIVNSSFGECELYYTARYNGGTDYTALLDAYDMLFAQGNAQGITFVASSGDSGALECTTTNYLWAHPIVQPRFITGVSFPASSPHVTAVGGTNLLTTTPPNPQTVPPTLTSEYVSENAWGDKEIPYDPFGLGVDVLGGWWGAGGGVSDYFDALSYQSRIDTRSSKRTVPDVGMQVGGCPSGIALLPCAAARSYVITWIGGSRYGLIGTSVAAPEFAGALALAVQATGDRLGQINTFLYKQAAQQNDAGGRKAPADLQFYHRDIPGYDGHYYTHERSSDYNYMTGNGTPDVRLLFGLGDAAPAGDPQTASNP